MMWTEQNWIVYCSVIWSIIMGVAENMKFLFNFFIFYFFKMIRPNQKPHEEVLRPNPLRVSNWYLPLVARHDFCIMALVLVHIVIHPNQTQWTICDFEYLEHHPFDILSQGFTDNVENGGRLKNNLDRLRPGLWIESSVEPCPNLLVGDRLQSDLIKSIAAWLISRFFLVRASRKTNWAISMPFAIRW